jgi:hypothetical protein
VKIVKKSDNLGLNLPEGSDKVDYQTFFTDNFKTIDTELSLNGTTASRPTTGNYIGRRYFDTTLNKPVFWNGSVWKDSTGATV